MKRISVITCILLIGFMMAGCTDLKEEIFLSSTYKCNFLGADNKQ